MRFFAFIILAFFGALAEAHADCNAFAKAPWTSAKTYNLTLEAHAVGPNCANSAVVMLVVDRKGVVQWSTTRLAYQNLMFIDGLKDNATMKAALAQWLEQGLSSGPQQGKDLPDWKAGKDQAERDGDGEFGFTAASDVSREYYLEVREKNQPMFCFVQGVESTSCITASGPSSISELGGFSFPG